MADNKVKITDIDKLLDQNNEKDLEWKGLTIRVKSTLPFEDMVAFVQSSTLSCFSDDTGEYMPTSKDFVIRHALISYYTDICLPKNVHKSYDFLYRTDIVPFIIQNINEEQLSLMIKSINDKVEYIAQSNIEALSRQMGDIVAKFSDLEERLDGMFKSMDKDAITKVLEVFGNKDFNENQIVKKIYDYVEDNKTGSDHSKQHKD